MIFPPEAFVSYKLQLTPTYLFFFFSSDADTPISVKAGHVKVHECNWISVAKQLMNEPLMVKHE